MPRGAEVAPLRSIEPRRGVAGRARGDLLGAQVAEAPEQVVDVVRVPRPSALGEVLQLELEVRQGALVDQLA
jgi:hypothetical protein